MIPVDGPTVGEILCPGSPSVRSTGGEPDIAAIAEKCRLKLKLDEVQLAPEYFYQSLPLCVIDSVFSINALYKSVQNVVERYCQCFGLTKFRAYGAQYPSTAEQHSISQFIANAQARDPQKLADEVFANRARTSSRSGILKAEAVIRFSEALRDSGVEHFQDLDKVVQNDDFSCRVRAIPGQASGLTTDYLFMLAGDATLSKPDRHVVAFWEGLLGYRPSLDQTRTVMQEVVRCLAAAYPALTVRTLDYAIWGHQRKPASGA